MMPGDQGIDIARTNRSIASIPRVVMNVALRDDCINICHMNAQSLCARQLSKLDEFKECFTNSKLDLICVTETWLHQDILNRSVDVEGYSLLRNDRGYSRGGGICLFYKSDLICKIVSASNFLNSSENVNRTEYLFVEVRVNHQKFLLGLFYCPPGVDCSGILDQKLSELSLTYSNTILIGDFNTNLNKSCSRTNKFRSVLDNYGLSCVNNAPTHFYSGGCSLIDLLLTNDADFIKNFNQVSAPVFSQHDIIFSSINIMRSRKNSVKPFRDYNRIDLPRLHDTLRDTDWSLLYSITDSDVALDFFNSCITEMYEHFVPLRVPRAKHNAPWFNDTILNAIIIRDIAYRQWTSSRIESDHAQFRRLRNRVTDLIRKTKSDYICASLGSTVSTKEKWKKLKNMNVTGEPNKRAELNYTTDEINAYFGGNFTHEASFPSVPPLNPTGFKFVPCTENEVSVAIFSITSNAIGLDGIPLRFIKIILPSIISPLTYLFNLFITSSKFPRAWKSAKVIPIRKKASSNSLDNLRPISILCSLSKAFEIILKNQIQNYIQRYDLLSRYQSGFRTGHSTTTALLKVHDDIHQHIDKKGIAFLLLIDFSKAFDRVSHVKLLHKLSNQFSFNRDSVLLIKSYLNNRFQIVDVEGNHSSPISILSGVPQGSVLGPLLFSLFINDLPSSLKVCYIHMFADDVQLYFYSTNMDTITMARLINADLRNVSQWSANNLLPINSSKTKAIFICRRLVDPILPSLFINNDRIDYVNKASNLGIIFQNNLEWDCQINSQCGKIYGGLRHLKLTAGMLPVSMKVNLFKSLLLPHLTYGLELTLNASAAAYHRLRVALNHCVRWAFNLTRYSSVTHLQQQLLGCSFYNFFKLRCCLMLFRIIRQGPQYLSDKIHISRSTRVQHFILPQHISSHYGNTFFVRAIVYWNQLPTNIKNIQSAARFHRECMSWLNESS